MSDFELDVPTIEIGKLNQNYLKEQQVPKGDNDDVSNFSQEIRHDNSISFLQLHQNDIHQVRQINKHFNQDVNQQPSLQETTNKHIKELEMIILNNSIHKNQSLPTSYSREIINCPRKETNFQYKNDSYQSIIRKVSVSGKKQEKEIKWNVKNTLFQDEKDIEYKNSYEEEICAVVEEEISINKSTQQKKQQIFLQQHDVQNRCKQNSSPLKLNNHQQLNMKFNSTNQGLHRNQISSRQGSSAQFIKGIQIIENQLKGSQSRQNRIGGLVKIFINLLKNYYRKKSCDNLTKEQHLMINDIIDYTKFENKNQTNFCFLGVQLSHIFKLLDEKQFVKVFQPSDTFKIIWDSIQVIFNFLFFYIFSIYLFFSQNEEQAQFLNRIYYIFIFFLISDIIIVLNSSFYLKDQIITSRGLILKNYLSSSLIFDLLSLTSSLYISSSRNNSFVFNPEHSLKTYLLNAIIFTRCAGISQKKGVFDGILQLKNSQRHFLKLINQLLFMVSFAHIMGIGWYLLGIFQEMYGSNTTWLIKYNINNSNWFSKYLYSLYWAVTTMTTGYGDVTPSNDIEALFNTISMILFSCLFAYSINNIGMILQEIEKGSKDLKDNIIVMQRYLNLRNVNVQLSSRIKHYLYFLASETKDRNKQAEEKVIESLSNKLRDELTVEVNTKMIKQCNIFNKLFSQQTINKLIYCIEEIQISPNEIIFNQNDVDAKSIYFILDGQIEIYSEYEQNKTVYKILNSNQYFGEFSFFSGLTRRTSARSLNLSTLYHIPRQQFLQIITSNQEDFQRYKMLNEQICVKGDISALNVIGCFCCGQSDHYSINCPKTHLSIDKQIIALKFNFFEFQERQIYQRSIKKPNQIVQALDLIQDNLIYCQRLVEQIQQQGGDIFERIQIYNKLYIDSDEEVKDAENENESYSDSESDENSDEDVDYQKINTKSEKEISNEDSIKQIQYKENVLIYEDNQVKRCQSVVSKSDRLNKSGYSIQQSFQQDKQSSFSIDELAENQEQFKLSERSQVQPQISSNNLSKIDKKITNDDKLFDDQKKSQKQNSTLKYFDLEGLSNALHNKKQNSQENTFENYSHILKNQQSTKKIQEIKNSVQNTESEKTISDSYRNIFLKDERLLENISLNQDVSVNKVSSETVIGCPTIFKEAKDKHNQSKKSIQKKGKSKQNIQDEEYKHSSKQIFTGSLMKMFSNYFTNNIETTVDNELNDKGEINRSQTNNDPNIRHKKSLANKQSSQLLLQALLLDQEAKGQGSSNNIFNNILNILKKKNSLFKQNSNNQISYKSIDNFEKVQIFSKFFPQNNVTNVLAQFKNRKLQHPKAIQKHSVSLKQNRRENVLFEDYNLIQKQLQNIGLQQEITQTQNAINYAKSYRATVLSYGINTNKSMLYPIRFQNNQNIKI